MAPDGMVYGNSGRVLCEAERVVLHRRTKKARKVLGGVARRGGVDGRWRSTSRRLSGEGGMKVETPRDSPRHGGDHVRWATAVENRGAVAALTGEQGAARSA
jgi:hypothetical protein